MQVPERPWSAAWTLSAATSFLVDDPIATYSNSQALWFKGSVVWNGHQRSGTWGLESIGINGCHRGRS